MARKRGKRGPDRTLFQDSDELLMEHIALPIERGELADDWPAICSQIRRVASRANGGEMVHIDSRARRLKRHWRHEGARLRWQAKQRLNPPTPLTLAEIEQEHTKTVRWAESMMAPLREFERTVAWIKQLKPPDLK